MQAGHYTVYGMRTSGNCYKVRLVLEQLALAYRWVEINSSAGETHTPEFLAKNPNGKIPLLELPDGRDLSESGAIMIYLAEGSALFPAERWPRAQALQWMFFEQYSHEPYVAVARHITIDVPSTDPRHGDLPRLRERGYQAFDVMEKYLQRHAFLAGHDYSVADIALFAYSHVASEGGYDLAPYPGVRAWLDRVRTQPRFVTM